MDGVGSVEEIPYVILMSWVVVWNGVMLNDVGNALDAKQTDEHVESEAKESDVDLSSPWSV